MDFCRISELGVDDKFMWQGYWYLVFDRDDKHLHYYNSIEYKKHKHKLGVKSQMFVQVVKANKNENTTSNA